MFCFGSCFFRVNARQRKGKKWLVAEADHSPLHVVSATFTCRTVCQQQRHARFAIARELQRCCSHREGRCSPPPKHPLPPSVGARNRYHLSNCRLNPETVHFLDPKRLCWQTFDMYHVKRIFQERKSSPKSKILDRISSGRPRGYPGGRPGAKTSVRPSKSWKTSVSVRTSMTRRLGRP